MVPASGMNRADGGSETESPKTKLVGSVGSGLVGLYLKMKTMFLGEGLLLRAGRRWPRQGDSGILSVCPDHDVSSMSM